MEQPLIKGKNKDSSQEKKRESIFASLLDEFILKPSIFVSLSYINLAIAYITTLALISGHTLNYLYALLYLPIIYIFFSWRKAKKEKERVQTAHRIPYFADALANSLSVGNSLEKAFLQASYYLKGKIKEKFNELIIKHSLGKDLGKLLWELENSFPNTGLKYLISLLEEYRELGVGISPLLKKISAALSTKEEAEEKIRTILAAGSSYARLSIGVFAAIFLMMTFLLSDQVGLLFSPKLKPTCLFLISWASIGILFVTRITAIDFAKSSALRPYIKHFMTTHEFSMEQLLLYSGINWPAYSMKAFIFLPTLFGFFSAYIASWYTGNAALIACYFTLGTFLFSWIIKFILTGMVEDQLIKTIETFPEFLQVFIVGLNSGLNTYLAFEFAQKAIQGSAPPILSKELSRAKFAMECGEDQANTWQRKTEKLPFQTIIDFSEIMVIAPMHGESIVTSINQLITSYHEKTLLVIEKKATSIGQIVIPLIVAAFFPLFLFVIFAPLVVKISGLAVG